MTTKDVGGGLQMVDLSKTQGDGAIDQYTKVLSLTDLANRIALAPAQREAAEMENQLKKAQVDLIPLQQQRAQFDFEAAQAGERRAQASAYFGHFTEVAKAFNQDFDQGDFALQSVIPGAKAKQLPDKSISIVAPLPGGGSKTFRLFPAGSAADPKEVASNEQNIRNQWQARGKAFADMDQNYRAMQQYALNPSGPGDLAMIIGYAKILDPNSVVRSEEGEAIQATSSLPAWVVTKYEQLKSGSKLDEPTRKAILENSARKIAPVRTDLMNEAKEMAPFWENLGYNPRRIYTPLGSLNVFKEADAGEQRRSSPPPPPAGTAGARSAGTGTGAPDYKSQTPSAGRSRSQAPAEQPPAEGPAPTMSVAPRAAAPAKKIYDVQGMTSRLLQKKWQKPGAQ